MRRKMFFILLLLSCAYAQQTLAQDSPEGKPDTQRIDMSTLQMPKPNVLIMEPVATFNTATQMLTITTDPTRYHEYALTVADNHHDVEYVVTSSVFSISLSGMSGHTAILIDSEDCGTYAGAVDVSYSGNTY